jgi:23S rRNA (uracil1939-C5)-methyltransferase
MPEENRNIGRVRAIGKGGRGVIPFDGKTVFVDRVLPGETVEFTITGKRGSVWFGSPVNIIEPSEDRIKAPCPHYTICGGCNFQHIAYPAQVRIKKNILTDNLKKISGIHEPPPIHVFTSPAFGYRTKVVLKVRSGKVGFLQRESHRLAEIDRCPLLPGDGQNIITSIRNNSRVKNLSSGEISVLCNGREFSALIKTGKIRHFLTPNKDITFNVRGFSLRYTPDNFIQSNRFTLDTMIGLVGAQMKAGRSGHAVDLFCGAGFFTLPLSRHSRKVTAIDNEPGNLRTLEKNLQANGIGNTIGIQADINRFSLPDADLYLVDPPRTGLKPEIIAGISGRPARKILYFSCDSATFCRDLTRFRAGGYLPLDITIIDNFPQTDHFEIFCRFENHN